MSGAVIGIRREDINRWERRAPLAPDEVARLVSRDGLQVLFQPAANRVFADETYRRAGAVAAEDLSPCDVIFAVKEVPVPLVLPEKAYVFFAHVVKGQRDNMPMLTRLVERRCSLIDYERIVDGEGRRLLFFGRFAGLAGMVDTLWALGQRLGHEGVATPFANLAPAWQYEGLEQVRAAVAAAGKSIAAEGLPAAVTPFIVGFAGYGNVSQGAQEMLAVLPTEEVAPGDVAALATGRKYSSKLVYKVVFREEDMVVPKDATQAFDLQDYYDFPAKYKPVLAEYLPYLTVLMNCVYWDPQYPHLVSRRDLASLFAGASQPRLRVIGDISCDVEGAIEATVKTTSPAAPIYVYDVARDRAVDGVAGRGPVILAVYNLPAELPLNASRYFSRRLEPFVAPIARADWRGPLGTLDLPAPIKAATVLHRGEFTPPYQYLKRFLK